MAVSCALAANKANERPAQGIVQVDVVGISSGSVFGKDEYVCPGWAEIEEEPTIRLLADYHIGRESFFQTALKIQNSAPDRVHCL